MHQLARTDCVELTLFTTRLPKRYRPWLTVRGLLVVSSLTLAAALGHGLVSAERDSSSFEFSPSAVGRGGESVVASLPLARATPDSMELRLSCDDGSAESSFRSLNLDLWESAEEGLVQTPLRYPDLGDELIASISRDAVLVYLGGEEILRSTVTHAPGCLVSLTFDAGVWRLETGDQELSIEAGAPTVAELAFDGPAASSAVSRVAVTTRAFGTERSSLQLVMLLVAITGMAIVIRDVVLHGTRESSRWRGWLGRLVRSVTVVDLLVVAMLLIWAVVIPPRFDDGWVFQRVTAFDRYSGNANFLAQVDEVPLGYWVDWLQSHWFRLSTTPLVMRLPNVMLGLLAWSGIRALASQGDRKHTRSDLWGMGAVFVVGYGAWGMTFREEPFIAVLGVAALWFAHRFAATPTAGRFLALGVIAALALTAHPVGVVVLAPALLHWKVIVAWIRSSTKAALLGLSAMLTSAAVALLLLLVDSDLVARVQSVTDYRAFDSHRSFIFDEFRRFELLGEAGFSSPLQRTFVVFLLMGVVGFMARRRGHGSSGNLRTVAGWTLLISMGLLTLTPSKWPWHFGALIGLVALAVPTVLLAASGDDDELGPRNWRLAAIGQVALVGAAAFGLAWAWSDTQAWASFDLRTQLWWSGATNLSPFDLSSAATWLVVGVLLVVLAWGARRWGLRARVPYSPSAGLVIVASAAVVFVTVSTFALDVVRTDGWTFGRQSVDGLQGASNCGLGERINVPVGSSLTAFAQIALPSPTSDLGADSAGFDGLGDFEEGAYPLVGLNHVPIAESVEGVGSWVGLPGSAEAHTGSYRSEWFVVPGSTDLVAVTAMGGFTDPAGNAVAVQWGSLSGSALNDLGVEQASPIGRFSDWSLVTFKRPEEATHVRVMLRDASTAPGIDGWVAASSPFGLSMRPLNSVEGSSDILVSPPLALYMPCIPTPVGTGGLVGIPDIMVLRDSPPGQTYWPTGSLGSAFLAAAASDRYYRLEMDIEPLDAGDSVAVLVSQRYLTGVSARVTGEVERTR
jgi:hypothetical protein